MAYVVVVERVVEGQGDASGISEEAVHALARQAFQKHFRTIRQSRHIFLNITLFKNKKGHQPAWFAPLVASEFVRSALSGAGYDDQYDDNNNDDR
jgi:hypothetical protein